MIVLLIHHLSSYHLIWFHVPLQPLLLFFFNDPATPEIYTLSLHDLFRSHRVPQCLQLFFVRLIHFDEGEQSKIVAGAERSEEHTSELQSPDHLVCRLLLEKKKNEQSSITVIITTENLAIEQDLQLLCVNW